MEEKYQYFQGVKFCKDESTGYYLNGTIHERMHRYVWKYYCGEIAKGFQVHHIDGDKSNNSIDNLALMTETAHQKLHGAEEKRKDMLREILEKYGRPAAIRWHKSEEGKKWHSEQGKRNAQIVKEKKYVCKNCGIEYWNKPNGQNHDFCSDKCRAAYRRKSGVDNETRICEICGKEFVTNKYSKVRFCSKECTGINRSRINEEKRKLGIPIRSKSKKDG